jgi:hypothetical protein
MTRDEVIAALALEMTVAQQIDDDGETMMAVLNRYLDEAELRGRNAPNVLTCVFCGHAYPPGSPTHGADELTAHVKICKKHPMARYRRALESIGKNTCGREPLAAAYARGVLAEED